ncbi:MAG: hypothetical protein J0L94_04215 [Rhodothermia bacterium]|nr:hypothetical protein [Rhodothermia bacterium]
MAKILKYHSFFTGILLVVFHPILLTAQNPSFSFEQITIQQGLSHNTVYAILQDRYGLMWFATHNGLNKYDGYGFKNYNTSTRSDPNFEGRIISTLIEDRSGNIWVGTQNKGINVLWAATGRFMACRSHSVLSALANTWITRIYEDRSGSIWITTIGKGIFTYDPTKNRLNQWSKTNKKLNSNHAFDVMQDAQGRMWAVTDQPTLSLFSSSKQRFSSIPIDPTQQIKLLGYRKVLRAAKNGTLWIGTERQGIFQFNPYDNQLQHYPLDAAKNSYNEVRDIEFAQNGSIMVGTDGGGVYFIQPGNANIVSLQKDVTRSGSLNTNALYDLYLSKDNNLWIGTYNGGINVHKSRKLRFENFTHTGFHDGELSHPSVLSIIQTKNGNIWMGTDGGGLNRLDPLTRTFSAKTHQSKTTTSLAGNVVKSLYEAPDGRIWIGYFGQGLEVFDPKTGSIKRINKPINTPASLLDGNIWSISGAPDGKLYIAILGDGLIVYDPTSETLNHYKAGSPNAKNLPSDDLMYVHRDRNNRVWIATRDRGLVLFTPENGQFKQFKSNTGDPNSLRGAEVRVIFEDHKGGIWVGTEDGGLNQWKGGDQFWNYNTHKGLLSESVMGIQEDKDGFIWVSTIPGLSRINPKTGSIENFNFHHHAQPNQFNQAAILFNQSGKLMVGGINGLIMLKPSEVTQSTSMPRVRLTELRIFNDMILAGKTSSGRTIYEGRIEEVKEINLSYLDNAFSIDFATSDLSDPQNNRFEYKLEGFHSHWQQLELPRHSVNFTNLEHGSYIFRIRGTNSMGIWSDKETFVKINISPPFWKTLPFRIFLFILFGILLWQGNRLLLHRRERHLREKMMESERAFLQLKNEKLASDLAAKNNQLVSMSLQMAHKNDFLNKLKRELKDPPPTQDVPQPSQQQVIKLIDAEVRGEDFWERFNAFFEETNNAFAQELKRKHPDLTANDLRICSLMLINVNTKEMASILNISPKGVEKSRYRVKKKLGLSAEDDLAIYLKGFGTINESSDELISK